MSFESWIRRRSCKRLFHAARGGDRTATEAGIATRGISWPPFWAELNVHRLYETNTELDTGTSENKYINGFCDRIIFFWHNCGKGWVRTLIGIPLHLLQRLKSAMNSAARLVFSSSKYDSVSPLLHRLHWLKVPKRIQFKLAVTTFKCLRGTSPPYLAGEFFRSSGLEARGRFRSASSSLIIRRTRLPTVSDRAFTVAAARVWNELPLLVTAPAVFCTSFL